MGTKKQEVTQKTAYPKEVKPLLSEITEGGIGALRNAQDTIDARGGQLFARRTAPQNLSDQLSLEAAAGGVNLGAGTAQVADQLAGKITSGQLFDPSLMDTTARDEAISAAIDPIQQRFSNKLLPQLRSAYNLAGAEDNSRFGIDAAQLFEDSFARPAAQAAAGISFQDLLNRRQTELGQVGTTLQASSLLPQITAQGFDLNLAAPNVLNAVGTQQQQEIQNILNEQIQAPFVGLNEAAALITGVNPATTTQTSGQTGGKGGSAISGAAGGALSGFAAGGPVGAGIGAGLGLLGGLF